MSEINNFEIIPKALDKLFELDSCLHAQVVKELECENPFDNMTGRQMDVLFKIYDITPCSLQNIAIKLQISASSASVMIDKLCKKGLLTRTENPKNRRQCIIDVSESSQKFINLEEAKLIDAFKKFGKWLGSEKTEYMLDFFDLINQFFSQKKYYSNENG